MDDKLHKLFACFEEPKHEKLFELCISQIAEIFKENPGLSGKILAKTSKLLHAKSWNQRVMGSSLLEKIYGFYCEKLANFSAREIEENCLEDALREFSTLFCFENAAEIVQFSEEMARFPLFSLENIKKVAVLEPEMIDFEELLRKEKPLYGHDDKIYQNLEKNGNKLDEEQFLETFSFEKTFELPKFKQFLSLFEEKPRQFLEESPQKLEKFQEIAEIAEIAEIEPDPPQKSKKRARNPRKSTKTAKSSKKPESFPGNPRKKLKKEPESPQKSATFLENGVQISGIFQKIFDFARRNLFHASWERRHSSCLIIRSFLAHNFCSLGFSAQVSVKSQEKAAKIALLQEVQREFSQFSADENRKNQVIIDILTRFLVVVSLDRFGDFLFEKFYLVVRESACQTFGRIIAGFPSFDQEKLQVFVKIVRGFLQKSDWQIVQSALYLVKAVISNRNDFKKLILQVFQEKFLVLMDGNEEIQQIITEIMGFYAEEAFLFCENAEFVQEFLQKCWQALSKQDEISYATAGILEILLRFHENCDNSLQNSDFLRKSEQLLRFFHHNLSTVRRNTYKLAKNLVNPRKTAENLESLKKIAVLCSQNLLIEEEQENELLVAINLDFLEFFQQNDAQFSQFLARKLVNHAVVFELQEMVANFEVFDNFSEINPYKSLVLGTKTAEIADLHYKRLIIVSGIIAKTLQRGADFAFLREIRDKSRENSSFLLIFLMICAEIATDAPQSLQKLDCDRGFLEETLNFESLQLLRCDFKEIEAQIFKNVNTFRILLGNCKGNCKEKSEFAFFDEFFRGNSQEKKRKFEEIYNKLTFYVENREKLEFLQDLDGNLENCAKQTIFSINNYVQITKELLTYIKISAVFLYLFQFSAENRVPERLNLCIRPLLASLSAEKYRFFAEKTAQSLFTLSTLFQEKTPSPLPKVLRNVINSLENVRKSAENPRLSKKNQQKTAKLAHLEAVPASGVNFFLLKLVSSYKNDVFEKFPEVFKQLCAEIEKFSDFSEKKPQFLQFSAAELEQRVSFANLLVNLRSLKLVLCESLLFPAFVRQVAEKLLNLAGFLDSYANFSTNAEILAKIRGKLVKLLRKLLFSLSARLTAARKSQEPCVFEEIFLSLTEKLLRLLKEDNAIIYELLSSLYSEIEENFLQLAPVFILKVLKALNHSLKKIREFSFRCLAEIINSCLVQNLRESPKLAFSAKLSRNHKKGLTFLLDFQNNRNFEYDIRGKIAAELRPYQCEGVKWLGFLAKYNLHGALCDDMGLGKTLQTLVVMQSEIAKLQEKPSLSIIVCPPTLAEHWLFEIRKYLDCEIVKAAVFRANASKNAGELAKKFNVLIVSYNNLQKSIESFAGLKFLFCVVDEAQVLKNAKTKISKSIKMLKAEHRFVLTGTPIQNNILELWSIFDFLMPEFLGDEEFFKKNFSKMLQINVMKFSDHSLLFSKEQDQILKELHRKITPFILRREKAEVLKELPQKIIQDYYCSMSEMQSALYAELEQNQIAKCNKVLEFSQENGSKDEESGKSVFELMILLRKLCNHPAQLLCDKAFHASKTFSQTQQHKIQDYENSGKFLALKDLLNELGFEESCEESSAAEENLQFLASSNKNKLLIFSKFKETLDLISSQLLDKLFAKLRYLRLDGTVPIEKRFALTKLFNEDSEYKILLLTTGVGGVGLNLCSANVVIMFDHDYNPMNDLQAIDRAHRIGQKNVLNVYRLIMKDTLEEKIMGMQKFKINVANAVINIDNASIKNIKESNILSLFEDLQQNKSKKEKVEKNNSGLMNPYAKIIENLQELWTEDEYKNI